MATTFEQLNVGWNADPNAPYTSIDVKDGLVRLSFTFNPFIFDFKEGAVDVARRQRSSERTAERDLR